HREATISPRFGWTRKEFLDESTEYCWGFEHGEVTRVRQDLYAAAGGGSGKCVKIGRRGDFVASATDYEDGACNLAKGRGEVVPEARPKGRVRARCACAREEIAHNRIR